MPAFAATAPGKVILFGEHAVVYDRPAIAAPVRQVQAKVAISADPGAPEGRVWITARDVQINGDLNTLDRLHPFQVAIRGFLEAAGLTRLPALRMTISSTIPMAAGLGSGAAISVAMARGLAAFTGRKLSDKQISAIAYEVDKIHHGTPSGIDNTVIAHNLPIMFQRSSGFAPLEVYEPLMLVIGGSGIASPTADVVGDVRRAWQTAPEGYERRFDAIGDLTRQAREAIEKGPVRNLGVLMNENHSHLQALGVSCAELDRLVEAARAAGALGAKLCGGGRGGNMVALVDASGAAAVEAALAQAGAVRTIRTVVE